MKLIDKLFGKGVAGRLKSKSARAIEEAEAKERGKKKKKKKKKNSDRMEATYAD